jgi:tetratricopeptide (TPR) repeat protein
MFYSGLALLCFVLALLSKISVVTLPLILAGIHFYLPQAGLPGAAEATGTASTFAGARQLALRLATSVFNVWPFFLAALPVGGMSVWFQRHNAMNSVSASDLEPLWNRLVAGGQAIWLYLWRALVPLHLMPIYPTWSGHAEQWKSWLPGLGWLLLMAVLGYAAHLSKKSPGPYWPFRAIFYGLGFFFLALVPVLGIVQISFTFISRTADHLEYLPLIGICGAAGYCLSRRAKADALPVVRMAFAAVVLVLFAAGSWQRACLFGAPEALWRDNLRNNPNAAMAWGNLANLLAAQQGRRGEALDCFAKSLELDPRNPSIHQSYADSLAAAGQLDRAIAEYRQSLSLQAVNPPAHNNLGTLLARAGRYAEAVPEFEAALRQAPQLTEARKNLGVVYTRLGLYDAAITELERVLAAQPDFPMAARLLEDARQRKASALKSHSAVER